VVIAVTAIATGSTAVAFELAAGPGHGSHAAAHHHGAIRAHAPKPVTLVRIPPAATPIMIPPAPSTTASQASDVARTVGVAPQYRSHVVPAVPGVLNSSPSNVSDPSVIATAVVPTLPLYSAPNAPAPVRTLANPNYLGAPLVLLVTGYQDGWVQAYVPMRPNESVAWIPAADVSISFVTEHIVISLGARTLTLYRNNVPVFQTPIAPGAPSSPTPTGSFFVAYVVRVTDAGSAYGPYAMGTSAFSNTYYSFEGGPGQVGIHGTNQPWVIGSYASHGCVRLRNDAITTLATQVDPGTPVEIWP
jgi:lipoprotein-anchoring transpeptidase ErfK/SrfK